MIICVDRKQTDDYDNAVAVIANSVRVLQLGFELSLAQARRGLDRKKKKKEKQRRKEEMSSAPRILLRRKKR